MVLWLFCLSVLAVECTEHEWEIYEEPATCTGPGMRCKICVNCGRSQDYESIGILGHDFSQWNVVQEPDCNSEGLEQSLCSRCTEILTRPIPAVTHVYEAEVVPPGCETDGYSMSVCTLCGDRKKTDIVTASGHTYEETKVDPTCKAEGYTLQVCAVCGDRQKTNIVSALGHTYEETKVEPTCKAEGYTLRECGVCGEQEKAETLEALGHQYEETVVEPTCKKEGHTILICRVCGDETKTAVTAAKEHAYQVTKVEPTCEKEGYTEAMCSECGKTEKTDSLPPLGHTFESDTVEPTCKAEGYTLRVCGVCGERERENIVPALGHDYQETVVAPTCTARGYTRHHCSRCGDAYRTDITEKLGHEYGEGVETKEPTLTTMGRVTYTCIRCADSYTETTPKWSNPFLDVDKKAYYFTPVLWASNTGITTGTSAETFSPEGSCTRGQVVTFLWRMAGEPMPRSGQAGFADVPADAYYAEAVYWAVEQGITNGVGDGAFAPDRICTRCEVVTFLHRYLGSPKPGQEEGFRDVPRDAYFHGSVYWAYEQSITQGIAPDQFAPYETCTRAQIVTFLYRARALEKE